jgi:xylulokinase
MKYVIGIDLGTNAVKAAIIDEYGKFIDSSSKTYMIMEPQKDFAEQKPSDWEKATKATLKSLCMKNSELLDSIIGISFSGQMHGLVMLDKDYKVIRPSIIWCDQRSKKQAEEMKELLPEDKWLEITGNIPSPSLTAAKLLWVMQNEPHNYSKCVHILLPKDYIRFTMTDKVCTEFTDASGTQLMHLEKNRWSHEICNLLNVDINKLPKILKSTDVAGYITDSFAETTGLPKGISVIAGAADQPSSAIGNGIIKEGIISDTLGSSGVVFAMTDTYQFDGLGRVNTFCHCISGSYAIMGVTQSCGLSVNWLIREMYKDEINPFEKMNSEIAQILDPSELIFLPYLMGERTPIMDPKAKGVIFGLTHSTTRSNIAKAVLEGISYSQLDAMNVLKEMGIKENLVKIAGGGSKSNVWTQMMADMFGCEIQKNENAETSLLGAGVIAFVGSNYYKDWKSAVDNMIHVNKIVSPNVDMNRKYLKKFPLFKSVYYSLRHLF